MSTKINKDIELPKSSSLMRKTKVQLVDIIFRKDDVEKKLRDELTEINCTLQEHILNNKALNDKYKNIRNAFNELNIDYAVICDEKATIECALGNTIKVKNKVILLLLVAFAISLISNIIITFFI